jgi:misacylated tRNA(Ala) deacylase
MDGTIDILARMHSAEHVLNAVMQRDFGAGRSVEAHFGPKKSKCDYRTQRPLTHEELLGIQDAVNAEVEADHPVTTYEVSREQAIGRYDLGKVPDSAQTLRIVQIGDLDVIPCIGQHVEHTGQIGRFVLRSADMKDATTIRIRFSLES